MEQLKMYRLFDTPIAEPTLPEGYSFSHFVPGRDERAWCECLRGGKLLGDRTDEEAYRDEITNFKDIVPERDIWFIDRNGEHIGTATGFVFGGTNVGDMHQVGIREDFRGKGLAKFLCYAVLSSLRDRGVHHVSLTTNEWRVPAVKSYLSAGFLPVEYDEGMEARWKTVLANLNIDSVLMLNDDATPYKIITKD